MVTIDLRDSSGTTSRGSRLLGSSLPSWSTAPSDLIRRRVIVADLLMGSSALVAGTMLVDYTYLGWGLAVPFAWPIALAAAGAYDRNRLAAQSGAGPVTLLVAAAALIVGVCMVGLVVPNLDVRQSGRLTLLLLGFTMLGRWMVSRWVLRRRRAGELLLPVLARGRAEDLISLTQRLRRDPSPTLEVVAVQCTDDAPLDAVPVAVRAPRSADPVEVATRNGVAGLVIVGPTDLPSCELRRVIWRAEQAGVSTVMLPIVEPVAPPRVSTMPQAGMHSMVFSGPNRRLFGLKKVLDRVLAAFGLVVFSPFLIAALVAIRLDSPGPILFRQTRVGQGGAQFVMLKFRTMCIDAEARLAELQGLNQHAGGTLFKIQNDPRITRVGKWLRRFSIDELPQLVNVMRGEMSLVGPRPPLPDEVANYPIDSMRRFEVSPGLTGLWQVSGRSNLDPVESARLDTQYVEHWSMALDLRILGKTAKAVMGSDGAY